MVRSALTRSVVQAAKTPTTRSARAKNVRVGTKRVHVRTVNAPKGW